MARERLSASVFFGAALLSFGAGAQSVASSPGVALFPPSGSTSVWQSFGEPTSLGGLPAAAFVTLPLRLSLLGTVFPSTAGVLGEDCASSAEASGNSSSGFPVQHTASIALVPSLTLHGFSRLGCSLDAAIGGALSYAVPLRSNLSLDLSAGILSQPQSLTGTRVRTEARVDLVALPRAGNAFSIGVTERRPFHGLTLTGGW